MLKRLSTLLLTIPTTLSLACGQVAVEPLGLEDEDFDPYTMDEADAEVASLVAAADVDMASLAQSIAAHPSYGSLSAFSWNRASQILGAYAPLDHELLEEESERLSLCQQHPSPGACYDQMSGVEVSFGLSPAAAAAGLQIEAQFDLAGMTMLDRVELFGAAEQAYISSGGPGGNAGMIPDTFADGTTCDATCKGQMLDKLAIAQSGVMAMASTGGDGEGEGGGGGFWLEIAIVVVSAWVTCILDPDCDGWPFDSNNNECTSDAGCPSDQYCWKGPLGIGDNECRDKKSVGEACSRDGKCLSGCCKVNLNPFSQWPLGGSCRPAGQCN